MRGGKGLGTEGGEVDRSIYSCAFILKCQFLHCDKDSWKQLLISFVLYGFKIYISNFIFS